MGSICVWHAAHSATLLCSLPPEADRPTSDPPATPDLDDSLSPSASSSAISSDAVLGRTRDYWNRYFELESLAVPQSAAELVTAPRREAETGKVEWIASYDEMEACGVFAQDVFFTLQPTDRILILGCGSSNLGAEL